LSVATGDVVDAPVTVAVTPAGAPATVTLKGPPFDEVIVKFAVAELPSCEIVSAAGETLAETGGGSICPPPVLPPHPVKIIARNVARKKKKGRM
jgi:hypothetical protein